jgi:inorganic pyrophosphatase
MGLLVLYIAIKLFGLYYHNDWEGLTSRSSVTAINGSSIYIALFVRVDGNIYTRAAGDGVDHVEVLEADPRS